MDKLELPNKEDFEKLGYDIEMSKQLEEASKISGDMTDTTCEKASKCLVEAMKLYDVDIKNNLDLIDSLNKISNF